MSDPYFSSNSNFFKANLKSNLKSFIKESMLTKLTSTKMSKQRYVTHYILNLLITHDIIRRVTVLNYTVGYNIQWWLGSPVVSALDSDAEGPGSNRSRDAVR